MKSSFVLSVSELNGYVQRLLASDPMLQGIQMRGEISNFKRHSSGHCYFVLKDDQARIQCVMFRSYAQMVPLRPSDGMRVVVGGHVALYSRDGQYQFYAEAMRPDGMGELYLQFERLKQKLQQEGLFDAARKRPLPLLPVGVGIVTSPTGAVLQDIRQIAARRNPGVPLILYPARVQGPGAAVEIVAGIRALERHPQVDVIIVGRGGGSLEDLWPFNEEAVARAIHACKKPVVSAVGHETDFTIADFVADLRAPTPSAAAELTLPDRRELQDRLNELREALARSLRTRHQLARERLGVLGAQLAARHPAQVLERRRTRLEGLSQLLALHMGRRMAESGQRLEGLRARLEGLGPAQVLRRGYALVTDRKGNPIVRAMRCGEGQEISVRLQDGVLNAQVQRRIPNHGVQEEANV